MPITLMKFTTPPEYVLRGLRMALGVAICLAIGYMGINYQFVGEEQHFGTMMQS